MSDWRQVKAAVERVYDKAQAGFGEAVKSGNTPSDELMDLLTVCQEALSARALNGRRYFDMLADLASLTAEVQTTIITPQTDAG